MVWPSSAYCFGIYAPSSDKFVAKGFGHVTEAFGHVAEDVRQKISQRLYQ